MMWVKRILSVLRNRFIDDTTHEGATESYGKELHALVEERKLDDTGNFDGSWLRTHLDLEDIEQTAIERIDEICRLAINMLNKDVMWRTCV